MATDDRLIYLISKAQHSLKRYLKKAFDAQGLDLTPVQAGILFLLKTGPQTMTQLSRVLDIDNSATTGLVDRLQKAGLANRRAAPNDRRTWLIAITEKGRTEINRALIIVRRVNEEIEQGFTDNEMEIFKKILNSFFAKFNQNGPAAGTRSRLAGRESEH